jgi:hypothetical protein
VLWFLLFAFGRGESRQRLLRVLVLVWPYSFALREVLDSSLCMKTTVDNELNHHSMRGAHCLSFAAFACPHMSVPFALPSVIPLLRAATRGYIRYPRTYLPSLETLLLSYQKLLAILGWQRFAVWDHPLHVQNWVFRSQTAQADTRHTVEHAYRVS